MGKGRPFKQWTPELESRLKALYPDTPNRLIGEVLGFSCKAIASRSKILNLKKRSGYNRMEKSVRAFRADEIEFVRWTYYSLPDHEIARLLGRSEAGVRRAITGLGLSGKENRGCFRKGHRPANFRKHRPGWAVGRMKETQFKKGSLPKNTMHDGAITIRYDHPKTRSGRPYKWIRIAQGKWVYLHRYLWEQANGPVPAKHVVVFRDGDTLNCELDNLKLITMRENLKRNGVSRKVARAAKDLTDNYVAGRLAKGNKKLRKALILGAPELIEAKRAQLQLKRQINHERSNKA